MTEESSTVVARVTRQDGEGELRFEAPADSDVTNLIVDLNSSTEIHTHSSKITNKYEVMDIVKQNDFSYSFVSGDGEIEVEYNHAYFVE
jgi:hypothetical protein